jgi:aconitate hydratase 2/2-methylisocitrate dehydratase
MLLLPDTYRYLNFDQLPEFVQRADSVEISAEMKAAAAKLRMHVNLKIR